MSELFAALGDHSAEQVDARLKAFCGTLQPPWDQFGTTFARNYIATIHVAESPFRLLCGAVARLRYQGYCYEEQINRGLGMKDVDLRALEEIKTSARRRLHGSLAQLDAMKKDVEWVDAEFKKGLEFSPEARDSHNDLMRQVLVLTWNAFEVLARDSVSAFMREFPSCLSAMASTEWAKRTWGKGRCESAVSGHPDVDELVGRTNFNNLSTVVSVFGAVSSAGPDLLRAIDSAALKLLFERRHLVVHRRGVVDSDYLVATTDTVALGSYLSVKPADLTDSFSAIEMAACELLSGLDAEGRRLRSPIHGA